MFYNKFVFFCTYCLNEEIIFTFTYAGKTIRHTLDINSSSYRIRNCFLLDIFITSRHCLKTERVVASH